MISTHSGRHSLAIIGRHTGQVRNGTVTTRPATTQQFPNPVGRDPLAAPSYCQAAPKALRPERSA